MTSTLIKTMQLLCYKENKELFNKKYEKKDVFINPLLFAYFNNKKYNFFGNEQFEKILIGESEYQNIKLSKIKLLKNKHPVLNGTFKKNEIPIDYEVIEISKIINDFYIDKLSNALGYLKANVSGHFELIEENCKAICLFNTSPTNTNSESSSRYQIARVEFNPRIAAVRMPISAPLERTSGLTRSTGAPLLGSTLMVVPRASLL